MQRRRVVRVHRLLAASGAISLILGLAMQALVVWSPTANASNTTGTGTAISYTLQGCRGSAASYESGTYICPTSYYTSGNLGKGWNELDLVPGRVTLTAGKNHPASETYQFIVAVDSGKKSTTVGYDHLSGLTLNKGLSSATCPAVVASPEKVSAPGVGGSAGSLYRTVNVSGQQPGTTCVYDFYARLALGSHQNSGSSLHFNLYNTAWGSSGIGAKDVSIPVSPIAVPGALAKSQTSTQGSSTVWTVTKSSTPATATFPNTCQPAASTAVPLNVSVNWTKHTTTAADNTVIAHISVQNNTHRTFNVSVADQLYTGSTPGAGNAVGAPITTAGPLLNLKGGASYSFDDQWVVPATTANAFNDKATATFTDPAFGDVAFSLTATGSSTVVQVPPTAGATAVVSDTEVLTGSSHFAFSVTAAPTVGTFTDYTVGTPTIGPVTWNSGTVDASGSVTFAKSITVDGPARAEATLSDTATLVPLNSDGSPIQTAAVSDISSTAVAADATVSIAVSKTVALAQPVDKTFTFNATGTDGSNGSVNVVLPAGSKGPVSGTLNGLNPGTSYTITEPAVAPFTGQTVTGVQVSLPTCSAPVAVENVASAPGGVTTTTRMTTTTQPPATAATTTTKPSHLAFTGSRSKPLGDLGAGLIVVGGTLLALSRRRNLRRGT